MTYVGGYGLDGALGLGSYADQSFPKQIMALSTLAIAQISAGTYHSSFVTKSKGLVFLTGTITTVRDVHHHYIVPQWWCPLGDTSSSQT